jgi:hypothetical protein
MKQEMQLLEPDEPETCWMVVVATTPRRLLP